MITKEWRKSCANKFYCAWLRLVVDYSTWVLWGFEVTKEISSLLSWGTCRPTAKSEEKISGAFRGDRPTMTTNPQDPQIFHAAPSTTLELVRAEIEHMMALVDHCRAEIESERSAHEKAATNFIARTEEHAAHIRAQAEAYAADVRRSANKYSVEQRTEIEQLRNSQIVADELLEKTEAEAQASLSRLVDAQLDARTNLTKVVNGIDLALGQHTSAPRSDLAANS